MERKTHWNAVYTNKGEAEVSWYQDEPKLSLSLIREFCPPRGQIIDVGGGASVLVDRLLCEHFRPAVVDVSEAALHRSKSRLGPDAERVQWIVADITEARELGRFDLWHDRAVFHFLTASEDRRSYVELAERSVVLGGHVILATFALDGPTRCSGLDVCRYDANSASSELGAAFRLVKSCAETHVTPAGKPQQFFYGVFQRV